MIHNHLLINHLPVFATLFGLIFAVAGLLLRNRTLRITALATLVLAGISYLPALKTGDGAHHEIEKRAGFDKKTHDIMHEHEESAEAALPLALAMAVLAAVGLFLEMRKQKYAPAILGITAATAFAMMFLLAQVANTGGQISHPELRKDASKAVKSTKDDD